MYLSWDVPTKVQYMRSNKLIVLISLECGENPEEKEKVVRTTKTTPNRQFYERNVFFRQKTSDNKNNIIVLRNKMSHRLSL